MQPAWHRWFCHIAWHRVAWEIPNVIYAQPTAHSQLACMRFALTRNSQGYILPTTNRFKLVPPFRGCFENRKIAL